MSTLLPEETLITILYFARRLLGTSKEQIKCEFPRSWARLHHIFYTLKSYYPAVLEQFVFEKKDRNFYSAELNRVLFDLISAKMIVEKGEDWVTTNLIDVEFVECILPLLRESAVLSQIAVIDLQNIAAIFRMKANSSHEDFPHWNF
jgi:hypothetical protein